MDGEATVQLFMAIVDEFIVMILFLVAGYAAPTLDYLVDGACGIPTNNYKYRQL